MKQGRDNFRTQKEIRAACYKARLIMRRKRSTIEEMREASTLLNKTVRTLQSWLRNANDRNRWRAEDAEVWKRLDSVHREKEPLIPLSFK